MLKRKYIYTDKQHTNKGIMSTLLGILDLASIVYAIYNAYDRGGQAPLRYAASCVLILVFSFTGIILGLIGRQESERFYAFAYIGIILNILSVIGISGILYAGAYI